MWSVAMISAAGEVEVLIFCITNPIDNFDLLISVFELGERSRHLP